jgi:hypothetical protein
VGFGRGDRRSVLGGQEAWVGDRREWDCVSKIKNGGGDVVSRGLVFSF